jgi:hypothetical protein
MAFLKHLRKTAVDADRWAVTPRAGNDIKSIDRVSTGVSTKSYTSGFSSGSRHSTGKDSTPSPSKSKIPKCLDDKTCNKQGTSDYHYMTDCPYITKDAAWSC